jgi:CubicO group peptidase (beta-lactamase class C family)
MSLIVLRNGKIVYEKYYDAKGANNVYSVTKSFMSALIGIAISKGYIGSENDTVEKYLPEYFKKLSDPRWKQITIKHLLTMTPGFLEDLNQWTSTGDWVQATFSLPLEYDPGSKFQYANSASHLLSVILTKATGMSKGFCRQIPVRAARHQMPCLERRSVRLLHRLREPVPYALRPRKIRVALL